MNEVLSPRPETDPAKDAEVDRQPSPDVGLIVLDIIGIDTDGVERPKSFDDEFTASEFTWTTHGQAKEGA